MFQNKNILIGITGGIAAYKICDLIRRFKKENANVKVICTQNAFNFVTKLTLQNLSQNEVYSEEFEIKTWKPEHISLSDWADIMVIAPATANSISKIAQGIADNLLTSVCCAFSKQMLIAPAMNVKMWNNAAIQENIKILQSRGMIILEPENGFLACGYSGKGRLCSVDKIFSAVEEQLNFSQILKGKKIIVTSGGTIEDIDPVRYISNYSSGKMGKAIADCAFYMGAEVLLITSKKVEVPYVVKNIKSAQDMLDAVKQEYKKSDYIIMAAAVADYRIKNYSNQKIKKTNDSEITLTLVKNPDILKEISSWERQNKVIVGFCAESENLIQNAKEKIKNKGCDYLVANDISRSDIGFDSDMNEVIIFDKYGNSKNIEKAPKKIVARQILEYLCEKQF